MPEAFAGSCNCGAVRARFAAAPVQTRQCWCRQCQTSAAGGPTHNAMFATQDVTLTGEVGSWSYNAASGNTLTQAFCPNCGTPVYAQSSARPQFMTFRFGFLEGEHGLAPEVAIWTAENPSGPGSTRRFPATPDSPPRRLRQRHRVRTAA